MAKFHLDRLTTKYGWTGGAYRALINRVIANNSESVSRAIGRKLKSSYTKVGKKFGKTDKRLFPEVEDVLPKRSVFTRKAAISGVKITDTLKTRLDVHLRNTMKKHQDAGTLYIRRGPTATAINPNVIAEFEKNITTTFQNYTRRNKEYGMPSNIHTIAVTEVRSSINEIKNLYAKEFVKRNPDLNVEKVWRHNKRLSEVPRKGHMKANGQRVPLDNSFKIEGEKGQVIFMQHPHDPAAPPEEVISCNCDWFTQVRRIA